jgi:hypothetical protein
MIVPYVWAVINEWVAWYTGGILCVMQGFPACMVLIFVRVNKDICMMNASLAHLPLTFTMLNGTFHKRYSRVLPIRIP